MSTVLLLVVVIAALAMFFDQKKRAELRGKVAQKQAELTEDETPTTATGRMKVAPVMKRMKEQAAQKAQEAVKEEISDEDEALPDPFSSGTRRPK